MQKIKSVLVEQDETGITHTDLYQRCKYMCNRTEFNLFLNKMHDMEMIQVFEYAHKKNKKFTTLYRARRNLARLTAADLVLAELGLHPTSR